MWLTFLTCYVVFSLITTPVWSHIPEALTTAKTKIDNYCEMAETCVHDTIPICGKNSDQKTRAFLDVCDLLEFGCDNLDVYLHIDDIPGCPPPTTRDTLQIL